MIQVDALMMLFFLEFTVGCMVLFFIFYFKNRKHLRLYQKTLQEILELKALRTSGDKAPETTYTKPAAADHSGSAAYAQLQKEKDQLVARVAELENKLETENKHLDALKKKYATLETEYSILYDKSFGGKESA